MPENGFQLKFGDGATNDITAVVIENKFMTEGGQGAALWKRGPSRPKTDTASRMAKPPSPARQTNRKRREGPVRRLTWSLKNQAAIKDELA